MKSLLACVATCLLSLAPAGWAQSPVVVELFTSQGCSSCPPADKMVRELAKRDDVIALALHVDYWDYIGWKDTFAQPAHAERQRGYAHVAQRRSIYTPQMIVNGQTDVVGARPMELSRAIAEHAAKPPVAKIDLVRAGGVLTISMPAAAQAGDYHVHLLRYTPQQQTEITRGENAGHTLIHSNVVDDWQVLEQWDGRDAHTLTAKVAGDRPAVVFVQDGAYGPIIAAAQIR